MNSKWIGSTKSVQPLRNIPLPRIPPPFFVGTFGDIPAIRQHSVLSAAEDQVYTLRMQSQTP